MADIEQKAGFSPTTYFEMRRMAHGAAFAWTGSRKRCLALRAISDPGQDFRSLRRACGTLRIWLSAQRLQCR